MFRKKKIEPNDDKNHHLTEALEAQSSVVDDLLELAGLTRDEVFDEDVTSLKLDLSESESLNRIKKEETGNGKGVFDSIWDWTFNKGK